MILLRRISKRRRAMTMPRWPKALCDLTGFLGLLLCLFLRPAAAQEGQIPVMIATPEAIFPADLSHLNHTPAGAAGRVRAQGETLVFADGSPARFWGVNIQANALFGTQDSDIKRHAARLARMGVNLVRLHHHDSDWVKPNIFGRGAQSSARLDSGSLVRLDAWIAALKARGIYIWLDLHVGRRLKPGDQIAHGDELRNSRGKGDMRGYNFVNDDIAAQMERFAQAYLGHLNPRTGLRYADEPAIAVVQISNENDLVSHFFNRLLPGRGTPDHAALFSRAAQDFAARHQLRAAPMTRRARAEENKLFLSDLEHRFFARMTRAIRQTGYDGLLATSSSWGGMGLVGLASLSAGDLIDVHSYAKPGEMGAATQGAPRMLSRIAAAQVVGMPLSVSEWNSSELTAPDRHMAPPQIAAMAAFQGWDALMLYGYAQRALSRPAQPGKWHAATDPALIATLPVGALLYRSGHIRPASKLFYFAPSKQDLFGQPLSTKLLAALREVPAHAGLRIALPQVSELSWMRPRPAPDHSKSEPDIMVFSDPQARPVAPDALAASHTGEIRRAAATGAVVIETPYSRIAMGAAPQSSDLAVDLTDKAALVAVQSLGSAPLSQAEEVLVSLVLPATPIERGKLPFVAGRLEGRIHFKAAEGLVLRAVVPDTARSQIAHRAQGNEHRLTFTGAPGAIWLILGRPSD